MLNCLPPQQIPPDTALAPHSLFSPRIPLSPASHTHLQPFDAPICTQVPKAEPHRILVNRPPPPFCFLFPWQIPALPQGGALWGTVPSLRGGGQDTRLPTEAQTASRQDLRQVTSPLGLSVPLWKHSGMSLRPPPLAEVIWAAEDRKQQNKILLGANPNSSGFVNTTQAKCHLAPPNQDTVVVLQSYR